MVHRQRFLVLSLANWALAIVLWSISAYLGVTSPTSLFVYSVLFVVALIAVAVGVLSWLVWRFGRDVGAAAEERPSEVSEP
ncbi:MAG TPA: hypothetical protein VJ787_05440, partial [Thermoleophilia bacterium]|nr:hypothetical protein [Thermoleophilia bacterium]